LQADAPEALDLASARFAVSALIETRSAQAGLFPMVSIVHGSAEPGSRQAVLRLRNG
jgi:hypothetical protein